MAEEWRLLTDEQKSPFLTQTEEQKQRYDQEMKAYKQKKQE